MFFLKAVDGLRPTSIQVGDRIRVRPKLGEFSVWRPVMGMWGRFPILRVRRAERLWVQGPNGELDCWLDLPPGKGDALQRILDVYGYEHFTSVNIRWVEEQPWPAIDGRFDYVAMARTL